MRRIYWTLTAPLALAATTPAFAQDTVETPPAPVLRTVDIDNNAVPVSRTMEDGSDEDPMAGLEGMMGNLFGDAFKAEPLTAEQEARLPAANTVVDSLFPEGTFAKMMDTTMKPMMEGLMGGMLGKFTTYPTDKIAALAGTNSFEISAMDSAKLEEVTGIIDPDFAPRNAAIQDATLVMVTKLMGRIEPSYRAGMARAYAKRFSVEEMAELDSFFKTPTGSHYAAEAMMIYADPEVLSAMNDIVPGVFELLPEMMGEFEQVATRYPDAPPFEQLNSAKKARLSKLLGVPVSTLTKNAKNAVSREYEDD